MFCVKSTRNPSLLGAARRRAPHARAASLCGQIDQQTTAPDTLSVITAIFFFFSSHSHMRCNGASTSNRSEQPSWGMRSRRHTPPCSVLSFLPCPSPNAILSRFTPIHYGVADLVRERVGVGYHKHSVAPMSPLFGLGCGAAVRTRRNGSNAMLAKRSGMEKITSCKQREPDVLRGIGQSLTPSIDKLGIYRFRR